MTVPDHTDQVHLSDEERKIVLGTVEQNITRLAKEYPDVTFYYFFTPYSVIWWHDLINEGTIYQRVEAEQIVIEEILKCENIKLYSFNNLTDITTDLNNYTDAYHYGEWINSLMLSYMKDNKCLLTYDNYQAYLSAELAFYTSYDYLQLNDQIDYDNDYYAAALLNKKTNDIEPLNLLDEETMILSNADICEGYNGNAGVQCKGTLLREPECTTSISDYILTNDYIGVKISVDDIGAYKYLSFYGIKNQDHGQPGVYIYDENNTVLIEFSLNYHDIDNQWHQYFVDISQLSGPVTIVFNGGYINTTGNDESLYTFSDMILY